MANRNSKLRKAIVMVIVLIVLVPCAFLLYDSIVSSGEEKVEFYYMTSDGMMKPVKKDIRGENTEDILHEEIGKVFEKVLEHAGVYKRDENGVKGFDRFVESLS